MGITARQAIVLGSTLFGCDAGSTSQRADPAAPERSAAEATPKAGPESRPNARRADGEPLDAEPTPSAGPESRPNAERAAAAPADGKPGAGGGQADSSLRPGHVVKRGVAPGLVAFEEAMPPGGVLWIGPLEGNGGRDVVVYMPPGARNDAKVEIVVHFHGTYSEHIEQRREGLPKKMWVGWNRLQQTIDAITDLQAKRDANVVLVYPISAGKRLEPGHRGWSNRAYDVMWMAPVKPPAYRDDVDGLLGEVEAVLHERFGVHPDKVVPQVIAEGHSAGGVALYNIAVHGSDRVGEYLFLDAGFQDWADGCHAALEASGRDAIVTLVITQHGMTDPTEGNWNPWCRTLEEQLAVWPQTETWCADKPPKTRAKGPAKAWRCGELVGVEDAWNTYRPWCEAMKRDMTEVDDVFVYRTKVRHGDQPRHFSGGLELPPRDNATWDPRPFDD